MTTIRRSLRSSTNLAGVGSGDQTANMAPSKKRKAAEIERYTCFSCADDKPARMFADYNPSPDCEHLINTCKTCLRKWVEASIQDANFKIGSSAGEEGGEADGKSEVWGVGCPECNAVMRAVNVQMAVPKKVYLRFDDLERRHIADTTPNWRWCLAPGCRAGQVHIPKDTQLTPQDTATKKRKRGFSPFKSVPAPESDDDIITCHKCFVRACARCDRPMHDGETCVEYQSRIKDRLDEEDKALKEVRKVSRPCPGCAKNIQKNGGCPSMHCSQCGKGFCWNCLQVFDRGYCKCHLRPTNA